jgi:hypothetical protein
VVIVSQREGGSEKREVVYQFCILDKRTVEISEA